jgi:hypothetical protein
MEIVGVPVDEKAAEAYRHSIERIASALERSAPSDPSTRDTGKHGA